MKKTLAIGVALASLLASVASPAWAAPKHHTTTGQNTLPAYDDPATPQTLRQPDVVTFGGKVVGEDPDLGIRAGIAHDPVPSEY